MLHITIFILTKLYLRGLFENLIKENANKFMHNSSQVQITHSQIFVTNSTCNLAHMQIIHSHTHKFL